MKSPLLVGGNRQGFFDSWMGRVGEFSGDHFVDANTKV